MDAWCDGARRDLADAPGVLLYEMLSGLPPFYDENVNTMFARAHPSALTAQVRQDPAGPAALLGRDRLGRAHAPDRTADARSGATARRQRVRGDQAPSVLRQVDRLEALARQEDSAAVQAECGACGARMNGLTRSGVGHRHFECATAESSSCGPRQTSTASSCVLSRCLSAFGPRATMAAPIPRTPCA